MQQQQCLGIWVARFTIEDVEPVDIDGTISRVSHGLTLWFATGGLALDSQALEQEPLGIHPALPV